MKRKNEAGFIEWYAWGWMGLILLIALIKNGIFVGAGLHSASQYQFETPILTVIIISSFVALWVLIQLLSKKMEWTSATLFGGATLLLPILYLISSIQAVSPYLAKYGVLLHVVLFVFFIAGILWSRSESLTRQFPLVFLVFGYLIVLYGFLTLFGNAYLLDSLTPQDGIRITSIFQYANAYAVMLLIMWIIMIIQICRTTRRGWQILHGIMLVPVLVSFLLTLSRGALIVLPIIAIVTLAMLRFKLQIKVLLYSIVGLGLSLLIYSKMTERGIEVIGQIQQALGAQKSFKTVSLFSGSSIRYWFILVGVSILMGAMTYLIEKYIEPILENLQKKELTKRAALWLPVGLTILFVLGAIAILSDAVTRFLPSVIRHRVENVNFQTHSIYERFTMYKDAIAIWRTNPVFGAGGGAWEALYERHQSYSYNSAQTHSFVTQLLVEVGLVGLVVMVALILWVIVAFLRFYRKAEDREKSNYLFYFITPVTILLHAVIDFEMSYLFYGILVFICLGVMAGTQSRPLKKTLTQQQNRLLKRITAGGGGVIALILIIMASLQLTAVNKLTSSGRASIAQQSLPQIIDPLKSGLKLSPGHPVILEQLISWNYQAYDQTKDTQYLNQAKFYLEKLKHREPNYNPLVNLDFAVTTASGDQDKAIADMEDAILRYPYESTYYEQVENALLTRWDKAYRAKNSTDQKNAAEQIMKYYDLMNNRLQIMADLPKTIIVSRPFVMSNTIRVAAGEVKFFSGDYQSAVQILQPGIKSELSDQEDRYLVRFYLAALRKQGQDDSNLFNQLIAADANEAQQLEQLK